MSTAAEHPALRYLDAGSVAHPGGCLADLRICTADDEPVGSIGGVLIEPARRRVRYFVVERAALLRNRRYIVPADRVAILDTQGGTIQIEGADDFLERFDPASAPPFSDDDLIATIFAPSPA